jgi:hypothetical protein
MPFNVADFSSRISDTGIAQTSQFEGYIIGGPGSYSRTGLTPTNVLRRFGLDEGMQFRIESLNMPGRTLTTFDQNYHGPARAIPYRFSQQPISFSIILSKDMREREVFMRWQDFLVGHNRSNHERSNVVAPFDTKYYQDGIGTIKIVQYSAPVEGYGGGIVGSDGEGEYEIHTEIMLHEAYPIAVNDIQMAWGDEGYGKLQVEMRYFYTTEINNSFPNREFSQREARNRKT